MEATGYTKKEVTCPNKEVIVSFVEGMFMLDELVGKGKNELEAVCNACSNFVNDPYKYNSFSIKYVTQLKKEFPDLFK
jgi:hypothetical protein